MLVLGWLGNPAATLGVQITGQGIADRFSPQSADCLAWVLAAAIPQTVTAEPTDLAVLNRFAGGIVIDGSVIGLPAELAVQFPGGANQMSSQAALKIGVGIDLLTGRLDGPHLMAARPHDRLLPIQDTPVAPGVLRLADEWRQRLCDEARRRGQTVSVRGLALAEWTIRVTNVPPERLSVAAMVVGRVRWQIELLFKLWKSHGKIDEWRSVKPWRVLTEVYAKLLAMVIQHWVLVVTSWQYPERSMVKGTQTVRAHACYLACVFQRTDHLTAALASIERCLAAGQVNKRRKRPNTCQLLQAVAA